MSQFNAADITKNALRLPSRQGFQATAEQMYGQPGNQPTSNYGLPSPNMKVQEASSSLIKSNTVSDYQNLSNGIGLRPENGKNVAVDSGSGETLGTLNDNPSSTPAEMAAASGDPNITTDLKVTIYQEPQKDLVKPVVFDAMPTITESQNAEYEAFTPLHHPGQILKYKTTGGRSWSISARLISRTVEEATRNLEIINTIRSWLMPYYGQKTAEEYKDLLGAPPPILTLSAYGKRMIGPVKCVLESFDWSWPNDVDYIYAEVDGEKKPFPVILSVSLNLKESWSPAEFSGFSLQTYRKGDLPDAFTAVRGTQQGNTTPTAGAQGTEASRSEPASAEANPPSRALRIGGE